MTQPREILTGNPTVIRMVVSFYRNAHGQNALRQILAEPVQEVLQNRSLSIRTSPVEIYRGWINETESQSGQQRWVAITGILHGLALLGVGGAANPGGGSHGLRLGEPAVPT